MSSIKNKYFGGSERGYEPTADYKKMSKSQKQAVYHFRNEPDGISRYSAGSVTFKEFSNISLQFSALYDKVND